jgi:hypothetical protein
MTSAKLIGAGLVAAAVTFGSNVAVAACTQGHLQGRWQVYAFSYDSGAYDGYWSNCTINIGATGTMTGTCKNKAGQSAPMSHARVTITPSSCHFTGQFRLNGVLNRIAQGTLATAARVPIAGSGVGTFAGGSFMFSIIKH